jgi:secondary thiamine-phosphate synthase enzyme
MNIIQKTISLNPKKRGFHIITQEVIQKVPEISTISKGICSLFLLHTSASLSINENADPTVRSDMEQFFHRIVPENPSLYEHTYEGLDDMTSHIKSSMLGVSITIPITNGTFHLGTWQGIYLCEHRNHASSRSLCITILGSE